MPPSTAAPPVMTEYFRWFAGLVLIDPSSIVVLTYTGNYRRTQYGITRPIQVCAITLIDEHD